MAKFNPSELHGFDIEVDKLLLSFRDKFIVPPFSILDARNGEWQDRKKAWLQLGIKSELGRGENVLKFSKTVSTDYKKFQSAQLTHEEKARLILQEGGEFTNDGKQLLYGDLSSVQNIRENNFEEKVKRTRYPTYNVDSTNKILNQPKVKPGPATAFTCQDKLNSLMESRRVKAMNNPNIKPEKKLTGTSIFDPVLCELAYNWWCPPGGSILDCFAGGSVRGIVASMLGFEYVGIELSENQVLANEMQWAEMVDKGLVNGKVKPIWIHGDSLNIRQLAKRQTGYDFVFSCPPYGNLEKYSDDPRDISSMSYEDFLINYNLIIKRTCSMLKDNRMACFVVGDFRDKETGALRGFVDDTNKAFINSGLIVYNDAILITMVGSLAVRTSSFFQKYRKLGRTHQMVMTYYKGSDFRNLKPLFEGGQK